MNQKELRGRDEHTIAVQEGGDQGSGDSAKPPGGRLTLVSLPCPYCRQCCAIHLWEILNMYGNDGLERSPHTCACAYCYIQNKKVETK